MTDIESLIKRLEEATAESATLRVALAQCAGVICESGNLNNYRNLSDRELGDMWIKAATFAADTLNSVTAGKDFLDHHRATVIRATSAEAEVNTWKDFCEIDKARAEAAEAELQKLREERGLTDCNGLDTSERVRFYEHDFYVLSNFSAFRLIWEHRDFDTSEAAYHFEKFCFPDALPHQRDIADRIRAAPSAHEAFKIAEREKAHRRVDWDHAKENGRPLKVNIMRAILIAKVQQHKYVRRKLLATGDRELVEDSWRDDFWGWGPNRDGQNMLGKLWMEIRAELRASPPTKASSNGGV